MEKETDKKNEETEEKKDLSGKSDSASNEGGDDSTIAKDSSGIDVKVTGKEEEAAAAVEEEEEKEDKVQETESDRYLRLAAEFDNYKKRTSREFGDVIKMANHRLLKSVIEILDNFERALTGSAKSDDGDAFREGIELTYNQMIELLNKENVSIIESVGKSFDPHYHEAMMQQESNEHDEGIICAELQKGYKIDNRVLRHSRVIVSSGIKKDEKEKNKS